jgi:hypothetical protein
MFGSLDASHSQTETRMMKTIFRHFGMFKGSGERSQNPATKLLGLTPTSRISTWCWYKEDVLHISDGHRAHRSRLLSWLAKRLAIGGKLVPKGYSIISKSLIHGHDLTYLSTIISRVFFSLPFSGMFVVVKESF